MTEVNEATNLPLKRYVPPTIKVATFEMVMTKALRLLSGRALTRAELRSKLQTARFPSQLISAVIADCERLRYLDDNEYIKVFCEGQLLQGYGVKKIALKMKQKGLAETLIQSTLENVKDDEAMSRAYQSKEKIFLTAKSYQQAIQKAMRYLVGRGFASSKVRDYLRMQSALKTLPSEMQIQREKKKTVLEKTASKKVDVKVLLKKCEVRYAREQDPYKRKQKVFRYLVSHGVDFELAKEVLDT